MTVSLATPEKVVFSGEADDILLNAEKGQLNILERHANLITLVKEGPLVLRSQGREQRFQVGDGVLKVENNHLSVLCREIRAAA